ncbi:MAG: NAD kinase [Lentimicrobiaceae bacterium]|nr:NAD kinase [Lentimicrobiaceae bacterium]
MNVALYSKKLRPEQIPEVVGVVKLLLKKNCKLLIWHTLYDDLISELPEIENVETFDEPITKCSNIDLILSIGGDGTIIDTVHLVKCTNVPIAGINVGSMGFLASIQKDEVSEALNEIIKRRYTTQKRTLLSILFNEHKYMAINEISINKKDTGSMLTNSVWVNDQFIYSFRADGIIVATPTGSTAYSMSCNGPIVTPDSKIILITPIAPHNLSVRPLVIPDNGTIKIKIESRENIALVTVDGKSFNINNDTVILVRKSEHKVRLIQRLNENFFSTLRTKLNWGKDIRI